MKFLSFILFLAIFGCTNEAPVNEYTKTIEEWQKKRDTGLKDPNGWLSLCGLYWLEEGTNTFGSAQDNQLIFPSEFADYGGFFIVENGAVQVVTTPVSEIEGVESSQILISDKEGEPTLMKFSTFNWFLIERGSRLGIRMKNSQNPALLEYKGMKYFPIDEEWALDAKLNFYPEPRVDSVMNVFGMLEDVKMIGKIEFNYKGEDYQLDAIDDNTGRIFVIFGDQTNGVETYGGGRYTYIDFPMEGTDEVKLDFNKAYNPPCVFTDFATCLLPTPENKLPFLITAGELSYK